MLQIKKKTIQSKVSYTVQFLLKSKQYNSEYTLLKKKQSTIHLRAPKHFNIGKQKISSLNYKVINVTVNSGRGLNIKSFLQGTQNMYLSFAKKIQWNTFVFPNSIKLTIQTKFIIKWLEF